MRDIHQAELSSVSGGAVPVLLGVLAFVYYEREHIGDFFEGAFEGLEQVQNSHK